eukprot:scaffold164941_cov18-Tisochrysis_lutea.AAC.1
MKASFLATLRQAMVHSQCRRKPSHVEHGIAAMALSRGGSEQGWLYAGMDGFGWPVILSYLQAGFDAGAPPTNVLRPCLQY